MKAVRILKYFKFKDFDTTAHPSELGVVKTYLKGSKYKVAGTGERYMDKTFVFMLDKARDIIEKGWNTLHPDKKIVFNINSGYRSDLYNDSLTGSVVGSAHTLGLASDIAWSSYSDEQKEAMLKALYEVGFRRFGIANGFVHVDRSNATNGHPTPAVWDYAGVNTDIQNIQDIINL